MKKRWFYLILSLCLSALALLSVTLITKNRSSYAADYQAPAAVPDLVISVHAGDTTVLANEVISFTVAYTNRSGISLSGVVITSTLSPKQIYTTPYGYLSNPIIAGENFTYTGNFEEGYTLAWQVGEVLTAAQGWVVVTTTVPLEAEPPWKASDRWPLLGMSAIITTTTSNVSTGNAQGQEGDDASVMIVGPVLRISKVDDPDPVRPGRLLTYTLTVENQEREDAIAATDLTITDTLPANTTFVRASGTGTYSPTSPTSGLIIWRPPNPLPKGNMLEVSFTVRLTNRFRTCPPPDVQNVGYQVSSKETIRLVTGKIERTKVADVVEKSIRTPSPPPGAKDVFPGGMVTYTISVYNPLHDQALTNLRVADTLPGTPNPFSFTKMLDGPQPITTSPQVVWDDLSVEAGGMISFTFGAWVPYHIDIGSSSKKYPNQLSASAEEVLICDMADKSPSEARVMRQIVLDKSVYPGLVLSGEIVTYTITLENVGANDIEDIRLTDTLPAEFYYVDMVYGPRPVPEYRHNPVVWSDLTVPAYSKRSLVFRAVAIGVPGLTYGNSLFATSPWTTIPGVTKAKVKIDSPFTLHKTVEPSEITVGDWTQYTIRICNVATGTQTIDGIGDTLYPGFIVDGPHPPGEPYHLRDYPMTPPINLGPGDCYDYLFGAQVTLDVGCHNLPATYWNQAGHVGFHVEGDPEGWWYVNPKRLAPLRVLPHVTLEKVADHTAVLPGETLVYTITMHNYRPSTVNQVEVIDTLPGDGSTYFEYVEMLQGPAPVATSTHVIRWEDLSIPPSLLKRTWPRPSASRASTQRPRSRSSRRSSN
ncbi:MAG TPA: DUF11 domain-containing protein [Chloroflexi bacterium]|nr:DUF11 domain-containing protein [Chloroflexota bacterium]